MNILNVKGFDNRFDDEKYPTGFIYFSDETRVTYSALIAKERDAWGFPDDAEKTGLTETHIRLAREFVDAHLVRPEVGIPMYEADKATGLVP